MIYTYSRALFNETLQDALGRDLWIDTHEQIYKYTRERNALKISNLKSENMNDQPGHFSFEADDGLADSIFNVELSLRITVPDGWTEDTLSVGPEGEFDYLQVQQDSLGGFALYNCLPVNGVVIAVYEGRQAGTGFPDRFVRPAEVSLAAAPNPFLHETLISIQGNITSAGYLIVRDIHGRIVREIRGQSNDSFLFVRAELAPGIYIIQLIESGKAIASLKLMAL